MAPKLGARAGFARRNKTAKNNMTIEEIVGGASEHLIAAVSYHSALNGACLMQSTNRSRSAIKFTLMLGDDREEWWCNSPEEFLSNLAEINDLLVETAIEHGHLTKPQER